MFYRTCFKINSFFEKFINFKSSNFNSFKQRFDCKQKINCFYLIILIILKNKQRYQHVWKELLDMDESNYIAAGQLAQQYEKKEYFEIIF